MVNILLHFVWHLHHWPVFGTSFQSPSSLLGIGDQTTCFVQIQQPLEKSPNEASVLNCSIFVESMSSLPFILVVQSTLPSIPCRNSNIQFNCRFFMVIGLCSIQNWLHTIIIDNISGSRITTQLHSVNLSSYLCRCLSIYLVGGNFLVYINYSVSIQSATPPIMWSNILMLMTL